MFIGCYAKSQDNAGGINDYQRGKKQNDFSRKRSQQPNELRIKKTVTTKMPRRWGIHENEKMQLYYAIKSISPDWLLQVLHFCFSLAVWNRYS
jgi:hypothetical protein